MNDQIQQLQARIAELEAGNKGLQVFAASHQRTLERCLDLKAECAELEAMLDAVGAGGVGESIKPPVQPDTAPQPTENLKCKSTQKRLATLWGYVKKEPDHFRDAAQMVPARQPLTDEKLYALYCEAMKGYYISSLHHWRDAEAHKFARAIEAAVANQPPRQPLTDSQVKELVKKQPAEDLCRWSYGMGIKDAEAAHGITGGQQ